MLSRFDTPTRVEILILVFKYLSILSNPQGLVPGFPHFSYLFCSPSGVGSGGAVGDVGDGEEVEYQGL